MNFKALGLTLSLTLISVLGLTAQGGKYRIMYISGNHVDCQGVGPMKCMEVKFVYANPWQLFYNSIEGFNFEPGYRYKIKVLETKVANPPADGSNLKYKLMKVYYKRKNATASPSQPANPPKPVQGNLPLASQWVLAYFVDEDGQKVYPPNKSSHLTIASSLKEVSGNSGCNTFGGPVSITGDKMAFGNLFMTKMFCVETAKQETRFMGVLSSTSTYSITGAELTLYQNGKPVAVLESHR